MLANGNGLAGDAKFWNDLPEAYKAHRAGESAISISRRYNVPAPIVDSAIHMYRAGEKMDVQGMRGALGEILVADPRIHLDPSIETPNPDVVAGRRGGFEVYDEMHLDDQVKAGLALKKRAVSGAGWSLTSPPEKAEDWEPTEFVRNQLENMPGTMSEAVRQICSAFGYGFSLSEIVLRAIDQGRWSGKVGLGGLKTRKPHSIKFKQDKHGNVIKIAQEGDRSSRERETVIPPWKAIHFAYDADFSNPYGTSDLQAAFRWWWNKRNAARGFAVLLEKFGVPPVYAMINDAVFQQNQSTQLHTVLSRLQMGSSGVFSRGKDESNISFWAPELAGGISTAFVPGIDMMNKSISRAILMPGLLGMTAEDNAGSQARARVNFDVFEVVIADVQGKLADLINECLVRLLVDLNFADVGEDYPVFAFNPMNDETRIDLLDAWTRMVEKGVVDNGEEDEAVIRAQLKMPTRDAEPDDDSLDTGRVRVKDLFKYHLDFQLLTKDEARAMMGLPVLEDGSGKEFPAPVSAPTRGDPDSGQGDLFGRGDDEKPEGEADDEDAEFDKRLVQLVREFALGGRNDYERQVNFRAIERALDAAEGEGTNALESAVEGIRDSLLKRYEAGTLTPETLKTLPGRKKLEEAVQGLLVDSFTAGRRTGKREISKARKNARDA